MLLAVDVGNTSSCFGLFEKERLKAFTSIPTGLKTNYYAFISRFLKNKKVAVKQLRAAFICSVVPQIIPELKKAIGQYPGLKAIVLDSRKLGVPIRCLSPEEVGIDRLLNALASHHLYKKGAIIVDFGTATTFDVVSPSGEYSGGAIAPGLEISRLALQRECALLKGEGFYPSLNRIKDKIIKAMGKNTRQAILSGVILGQASLVEGMIVRLKKEINFSPLLIATGGYAPLMKKFCPLIKIVDPYLTLKGIRIAGQRIKKQEEGKQ